MEKDSQAAALPQGCRPSWDPSPPLAVVGLPTGVSASSLVWTPKNFLVGSLIPLKNVSRAGWCVKVHMKERFLVPSPKPAYCRVGAGTPWWPRVLPCTRCFPPRRAAGAGTNGCRGGRVLGCSAQRVWQNFGGNSNPCLWLREFLC